MPDIFISYSSRDREQATVLAEMLTSAGLSCWIDQHGIGAATSWSKEIVDAIDECTALLVLLSPSSVASVNVVKEISLAAERHKKILPLDLEPVTLPNEIAYHLAGIQRAPMTNIDAIIRALGKLGLEATGAPQAPKIVKEKSDKKSLMILPFDDLSPTGDNGWFADGIASELISALSNVKTLRVADQQATKDYKRYQGTLPVYAREMGIRYFVQGDVRKFGDNIKITARLLDIESGDHLWQESLKGTMNDVFEIQEQVAQHVAEGLQILLTTDEKKMVAECGTTNAEAYEHYLKATEYYHRQTKEGLRLAIQQLSEATALDPQYAVALQLKAASLLDLYRNYTRDPDMLTQAEALIRSVLEIHPELWAAYSSLSILYRLQGKLQEAEEAAKECVRRRPDLGASHFALAFHYTNVNKPAEAIDSYARSIVLRPENLTTQFNIVTAAVQLGDAAQVLKWANAALPFFERRLRLEPDNEYLRVRFANLLRYAGLADRAVSVLTPLLDRPNLDGNSLFNIACLYAGVNEPEHAMETLRRSVTAGYRNIEQFRMDNDLDPLRELPEFKDLLRELETAHA